MRNWAGWKRYGKIQVKLSNIDKVTEKLTNYGDKKQQSLNEY
jgi:hypothetical protein